MSPVSLPGYEESARDVPEQVSENPSGDPDLAFPNDEVMAPPVFKDKYQERKYLKHRLVLAFRIFAKFDLAEGVAGHITLRDPVDPECFWVNPFGRIPQLALQTMKEQNG